MHLLRTLCESRARDDEQARRALSKPLPFFRYQLQNRFVAEEKGERNVCSEKCASVGTPKLNYSGLDASLQYAVAIFDGC